MRSSGRDADPRHHSCPPGRGVHRSSKRPCLLPVPEPYDVPVFTRVKVHRDFHVEVARALYSLPQHRIGRHLEARADSELVKLYARGQLVKTHPRQRPGPPARPTVPTCPRRRPGMRCGTSTALIAVCARTRGVHRDLCRAAPRRPAALDPDAQRLPTPGGLVRRYGPGPVETACTRSLDLDVVSVAKIASMLEKAIEREQPVLPAAAGAPGSQTGRFARDPAEYATRGTTQLRLIPGGAHAPDNEMETTP